jgi:hypothetical protein
MSEYSTSISSPNTLLCMQCKVHPPRTTARYGRVIDKHQGRATSTSNMKDERSMNTDGHKVVAYG